MGTRSILFTCMGTRGDVQPFCALGQYLAERGWQVTMAAPAEFQEFVGNFKGLDFADIGRSIQVGCLFHVTWEGGQGARGGAAPRWGGAALGRTSGADVATCRPSLPRSARAEGGHGDARGPGHAHSRVPEDFQGCPGLFQRRPLRVMVSGVFERAGGARWVKRLLLADEGNRGVTFLQAKAVYICFM